MSTHCCDDAKRLYGDHRVLLTERDLRHARAERPDDPMAYLTELLGKRVGIALAEMSEK